MFSRPCTFCRDQFFGTRGKVVDFDFWLYFSNNTSIIYKKWTTSSEYDDKQMYGTKTHKFQEMKKVEILFSYNCCWLSSGLTKKVVPSKCTWPWEHFKKILCHRFLISTLLQLFKLPNICSQNVNLTDSSLITYCNVHIVTIFIKKGLSNNFPSSVIVV